MKTCIEWLRRHPVLTCILATGYFFAVVLPHEHVQVQVARLFEGMPRQEYQEVILVGGLAVFGMYLAVLGVLAVMNRKVNATLAYLAITLILLVLSVHILVIHNFEMIHFPQYIFLAILIFPLVMRYGETVFWTTLLGAVDEAYQYFYLAPQRTAYFDFNDIILNLLGAALGVLLIFSSGVPAKAYNMKKWYVSPVFRTIALLVIGITILFQTPLLNMYPSADETSMRSALIQKSPEGFWEHVPHLNDKFHIVRPIEGILLVILLLLLYYTMDIAARRRAGVYGKEKLT
jgi:hypothetical protein